MKVAVIGSRAAKSADMNLILCNLPEACTEIVSGGAQGIDCLAESAANIMKLPFTCLRPDYARYGRLAPLQRNLEIIAYSDMVLAFWNMKSPGTRFVINECLKRDKPLKIIPIEGG